jgi:glycosyltransferase involved in cell wall biosynthesis
MLHIHHMNLQRITGGGEVYTHAMTRAFAEAGARVSLYAHPANRLWDDLSSARIERVDAADEREFLARLPQQPCLVVAQGPITQDCITAILERHRLAAFAHMPMVGTRSAHGFKRGHLTITVSRYCIDLLRRAGVENLYPEPMYGTTEAQRGDGLPVVARSPYRWDRHKLRDVVLGALEPIAAPFRPRVEFERSPGLTLGVVSLLSTIKQFPLLFGILAPLMASRPAVRLEIFGDGGYAQVRDIRRALAPLGERVRFWGYQANVQSIYPQLDYLLTGLPEKEALGLNALEAQVCGTPVLAPDAPPFSETVLQDRSGFRYRDPREDAGADFARLLDELLAGRPRPDPRIEAAAHLAGFSFPALVERTRALLGALRQAAAMPAR